MSDILDPHRRTGSLSGHCLCGEVRIDVSGDYAAAVGVCHCRMCQRWNGAVFGCFSAAADAVRVRGPVKRHASSSFAERAFCATCGSHLWMRDTDAADAGYDLMPGLFPDTESFPLVSEIYVDCAPAYVPLAGEHRRKTQAEYEQKDKHVAGGDAP